MAIRLRNSQLGGEYVEKDRSIENSILERRIRSYENDRLKKVRNHAFYNHYSLQSIDLPNVSYIGNLAFNYCSSLQSVNLSMVNYIGNYAFQDCYLLQSVNLPNVSYIGGSAFRYCYNLLSLYLRSTSICSLYASNAFSSTPIAGYTTETGGQYGSIYVPASLYSSYIITTNWAVFSSRFVSI